MDCLKGDTVTLECTLNNEESEVAWFVESKPLKANKKYEISKEGVNCKLTIHDATMDDQKKYSCKCRDEATSCSLVVEGN